MTTMLRRLTAATVILVGTAFGAAAADKSITVASTTSTEQSGLFGYILPKFKEKNGIEVLTGILSAAGV